MCAAPCDDSIECSNGFDESPHIGCVEVLDCGSAVALTTSVPQEILSPDYPNGYDNDKTCEWTVTSAGKHPRFNILAHTEFFTQLGNLEY